MANPSTSLPQAMQLRTSCAGNTTSATTKPKEVVDKVLLRLIGSYPGSRFAYALQDEKTYALTRYEWAETLEDLNLDESVVMEAIKDAKTLYDDVPTISQFVEIAKRKAKLHQDKASMDERRKLLEAEELHRSEYQSRPRSQAAEKALEEIRRLCNLKKLSNAIKSDINDFSKKGRGK